MGFRASSSWVLLGGGLLACTPDKDAETGGPGTDATGGASEGPTGGETTETGGSGDHGDCEQYIECLEVVMPDVADEAEVAYGAGSQCWSTSEAVREACLMACAAGLEGLGLAYPDEPVCGGMGGEPTSTEPTDPTETATTTEDSATTTGAPGPSFNVDVWEPILAPACTCHQGGAGGLEMGSSAAEAYATIVGIKSTGLSSMSYVEPGDPGDSYLFHKLNDTHIEVGGQGGRMPLGGQLSLDQIDTIKQWIAGGALP